jgi:hypothetical protein
LNGVVAKPGWSNKMVCSGDILVMLLPGMQQADYSSKSVTILVIVVTSRNAVVTHCKRRAKTQRDYNDKLASHNHANKGNN